MKSQLSLYVCRRNLHVFIACLLTFALITTPFIPIATAMSPGSAVSDNNSEPQTANATGHSVNLYAAVPAPAPPPFVVPAITATKIDALVVDVNGDTNVDPGDTIEYTIQINNGGGATDASDVVFNDTIDAHTTLVGGSVSSQPIALNDTYSASGNIQISLAAPGVLTNDRDPDTGNNSGLTVTKVQGVGANVGVATDTTATGRSGVKGSVTLQSNGSFTYEPPPGFTGAPGVDTFTYEISDGTKTDTATVTINITQMAWFISNNAGGLNRGTFSNPFTTIAAFNTANAGTGAVPDPKNGDFIALRTGTGTYTEADGINLRSQQKLIGNAIQFNTVFTADANSSSAYTTFASTTTAAPNIVTTAGNGIDLSTDNTVRGLNVGNTPGFFKINGTAVGSPIINTVNLTGTGGALNVSTSGAFAGNVTFGTFESTSSPTSNLNLVGVTGTLGITSAGTGLSGSAAASPAVNVSGGTVSFVYGGNVSKTNAGALVSVSGGHGTGTLTFQTGTLSATSGTGFQFDNADGVYNFNGTNTLNGGDAGIDILNGSGGTFSFSAASTITSPTGTAFNVGTSPGSPNVTYSGSITHNTAGQRAVNIDGTTGGAITINSVTAASIAGGAGNTGININNASGSVTFTTLNLGGDPGSGGTRMTAQAVTIAGGTGAKNLGTVSIFTTGAAEGIHSTTTTGAISITTGTVNSAGAAAINIAGTSAGSRTPLNVQLTSLAANGGAKGLILLNTSATGSPGGFRVNGTGTTDGSGGTIQNTTTRGADIQTAASILLKNMNFTNANSSADGGSAGACDDLTITNCNGAIYLNGLTTLATFDNLNLTGTMVENGVTALNVANFKFDNSVIDGAGNEVHESGIEAQNLSGTATVNTTEIRFSETDAFAVTNFDTTVNLTISGSTFRDSQTVSSGGAVNTNGEGGFQFRSFSVLAGQPTATINVLSSSFLRLRTQSVQVFAQDDTIINFDLTGSTLDSQADIGTGIDINSDDTATFNFNILNNPTIQSRGGAAVNITSFLDSHMEGRVNNNTDIEVLGGAGIPVRLVAQETSDMVVEINGNTVSNVNGTEDTAIDAQSRFQNARVDVTITNNSVTGEPTGVAGINLISGSSTAGESNITCGDVSGNNVTNALGNTTRAFRLRLSDLSNANRLFLEGFLEGGTQTQDAEGTWNTRANTPTSNAATPAAEEVVASLTGTAVDPSAPPGGVCLAVDTPGDFLFSTSDGLANNSSDAGSMASPVPAPAYSAVTAATSNDVVRQPATSTQPSLLARAVDGLARFANAVHSLVEPTAYASDNPSRTDSAQPVYTGIQTTQLRTENSTASTLRSQKTDVKSAASGSRKKVLSNHARGTRVLPMMFSGETVNVNIGTLTPGDSVTITFRVTVDNPPNLTLLNPPRVRNQGTVSGSNFTSVLTDDPALGGAADPTDTPIDLFDTSTNLVSDLNPSNFGDLVTFTATVTESPTQATADPTGTVDFIDTSNGNAVVCDNAPLTAGSAQCQTSTLTAGTHNIRADYSGDGNFDPSQSNIVAQVVNACIADPIVTSTADSGDGSLRKALADVCTGDTITFNIAGAGPHTITLTTGELVVAKDVTINNNSGESITVSGGGTSRVFNINSGKTASIIGLTISGGNATNGAGIINDGALTVVNSTLSGNTATGDGGAISTTATGTSLTLINTTISGNSAAGSGGGVIVLGGIATSVNTTITNNVADSDNNATGTGGGLAANSGTTTLKNTIVAGNFNEDGASDAADDISGTVDAASSFNLIGTGGAGGLTNGVNNNQVGVANAGLGPLANNGGTTSTHALLPTSSAVEAGSNANLTADVFDLDGDANTAETLPVDQRGTGFPRVADSQDLDAIQTVDIGAFELHPSVEDITDKSVAEDTLLSFSFNLGDGTGSLIATVTATSGNTTLIPNANISVTGSGTTRTLDITPATNANTPSDGTATITVTVTATNGRTAVDTFVVTVTEVNDNPVAVDDVLTAIDEDSGLRVIPFADLLTNDSKGPANENGQTLTVTNVSNPVGGTVAINGTNVEFTLTANFFGTASFDYIATDNGTTNGVSDPKSDTGSVSFTINAINDPPSFTIAADPPASNEDAGPQTVLNFATAISAGPNETGQTLTFNITPGATTGTLTFSSGPSIDATTGTLTYTATGDTNGTATFSVTLSDNGSNTPPNSNTSAAQQFTITVNAQNDAPVVTTTAGNLAYTENDPATAIDTGLTVTDGDSPDLVGATVAITAGFVSAQDTLAFTNQNGITGNYNSGTGVLTLTGTTTVANYQTALRTVTYQNSSDNPTASRTVSFTVNDGTSNSNTATRGITITAVNDAPVNTVPGPQSTNQNTPLIFSSGNGNQISVADVDAGSADIRVTLTAANGTITLATTAGLSFTAGDGTADATMTFDGTLTEVNTAMNGMSFTPTMGFSGAATLTITSNDLGNTGTGGPLSDTDVVNIQVATNVSIQDAQVSEPSSGSVDMIFTVTLSAPAPAGGASVNFATANGGGNPATAGICGSGGDYVATNGTVSFATGEQFKTILVSVCSDANNSESDETFLVNLSSPVNATITDGTATGTILVANQAGTILISELRTSGPAGAGDDFVEIYNNSNSPHTVNGTGGGYGLFKMGATCSDTPVLIGVIPNGTVIPARGHYLFTGSAYSLANYGGPGAAAGDATLSSDIESDRNVAIFSTATLGSIGSGNRLDAVGFGANTGGTCDLFREGTTLTPLSGSVLEYSYVRDECGKKGNPAIFGPCPTGPTPKDSNVNDDDFVFVETSGTATPAGQRLGAPGPENLGSPRLNLFISVLPLDATKALAAPPNRARDLNPQGPNAPNGTLTIRRRFVNNTGAPVTRLRLRIVDISALSMSPGIADVRALDSVTVMITGIADSATCQASTGSPATPCTVTVLGTTLEQPPTQSLGGALNSTLTVGTITLGTPLASGASINLQAVLGVVQTGAFKFFINVEALP